MKITRSMVCISLMATLMAISHPIQADELPIPPLLESKIIDGVRVFSLRADEGKKQFLPKKKRPTSTLGYNGDYLGPTIRTRMGENIRIDVENRLRAPTTVHWHGLDVPAEADGNIHQPILPGGSWSASFPIQQAAATLWYHPHFMETTAEQVYEGLSGLFIIDDPVSDSLNLPRRYGIDDIPLILQERRFDSSGRFSYKPSRPDIMHGYSGNALLVNGAITPTKESPRHPLRLRILNGSNSTILRINAEGLPGFFQVATDGGFLDRPVPLSQVVLSTGERAELVLDLSRATGDSVTLWAESNGGQTYKALVIHLSGSSKQPWQVPSSLSPIARIKESEADRSRNFVLQTAMGGRMTINGDRIDMHRIDEHVRLGSTEIWEIENRDSGRGRMGRGQGMGMMNQPHSFHIHAVQFLILDINGRPPPENLSGWKDTVLLWPGDKTRFITRFQSYPGVFMYHCHLLEHEDNGMMGQFLIE